MNNEKLNSTPKLSIAKREIFRICKDPVYFFCMLVAPTICVVFFLSLMKEGLPTDMPVAGRESLWHFLYSEGLWCGCDSRSAA